MSELPHAPERRPWYARFTLFPDRASPTYVLSGFTPPTGTSPREAAQLRYYGEERAPGHTILHADERAALYETPERGVTGQALPLRHILVRYDDLPGGMTPAGFPTPAVTEALERWLKQAPVQAALTT